MGDFVCDAMLNYIANQVRVDGSVDISGGVVPLCQQVWTVALAVTITLTLPGTTNVDFYILSRPTLRPTRALLTSASSAGAT